MTVLKTWQLITGRSSVGLKVYDDGSILILSSEQGRGMVAVPVENVDSFCVALTEAQEFSRSLKKNGLVFGTVEGDEE